MPPFTLSLSCAASLEKCCGEEVSVVLEQLLPVPPPLWPGVAQQGWRRPEVMDNSVPTVLSTGKFLSISPAFGLGANNKELPRKHHQGSGPGCVLPSCAFKQHQPHCLQQHLSVTGARLAAATGMCLFGVLASAVPGSAGWCLLGWHEVLLLGWEGAG